MSKLPDLRKPRENEEVIQELIRGSPNETEVKHAVDRARVVLFNRLQEGARVEDAIKVSLQPHGVRVGVQPHVAREVEDKIVQTYRDQAGIFPFRQHNFFLFLKRLDFKKNSCTYVFKRRFPLKI